MKQTFFVVSSKLTEIFYLFNKCFRDQRNVIIVMTNTGPSLRSATSNSSCAQASTSATLQGVRITSAVFIRTSGPQIRIASESRRRESVFASDAALFDDFLIQFLQALEGDAANGKEFRFAQELGQRNAFGKDKTGFDEKRRDFLWF